MKKLICAILALGTTGAFAASQDCGAVTIEQILTGPRHQAMLLVSDRNCGKNGYVCIDTSGKYASKKVADYMFTFALSQKENALPVNIMIETSDVYKGCGYDAPYIEDIRSVY